MGGRKCCPPRIRIDGELISEDGIYERIETDKYEEPRIQNNKVIYKNSNFNVNIESEPNSIILFTTD